TLLHEEKRAVRAGKGGISQDTISQEATLRIVDALKYFVETGKKFNVTNYYPMATSAFRNAKNSSEIKELIKSETGLDVQIISGSLEAEFIYLGVKSICEISAQSSLIMDIGGGSVEFILANDQTILWKKSYEIGAQRLLDKFHHCNPIQEEEIDRLFEYLKELLIELEYQLNVHSPYNLIGASGTFDTLKDLKRKNSRFHLTDEKTLSMEEYELISREIITSTIDQRRELRGMSEMRVDMIVVATCLINYIRSIYSFDHIDVSSRAMKEGVLYRILSGENVLN
ncbi:MAG: exopolyphosphatase, partial [Cyclobacteriaceae bacterium]|nr:exopolyphosphatase [Cyclobacteriaceae bacterium]